MEKPRISDVIARLEEIKAEKGDLLVLTEYTHDGAGPSLWYASVKVLSGDQTYGTEKFKNEEFVVTL